jgi:hypothetical protein
MILPMANSRAEDALPFIIETANSLGLIVFDEQIHRGLGIKGVRLRVENEPTIFAPTVKQVWAAVDRMNPRRGPGFVIVEGPGRNYAQTAGGDGSFTTEWRQYSRKTFKHFVAGLRNVASKKQISIRTHGFRVKVQENEKLSAADVKRVLAAFARGQSRPRQFLWRDMTELFS